MDINTHASAVEKALQGERNRHWQSGDQVALTAEKEVSLLFMYKRSQDELKSQEVFQCF